MEDSVATDVNVDLNKNGTLIMLRGPKAGVKPVPGKPMNTVASTGGNTCAGGQSFELCRFQTRKCSNPVLENYRYCYKHILEDKAAPFKACSYVYSINGKRCLQPAPRCERRDQGYCLEHARKTQLQRQKSIVQHIPPLTPESLLASLAHYSAPTKRKEDAANGSHSNEHGYEEEDREPTKIINPFLDVDVGKVIASGSRVLDYASDSESDVEVAMMDSVWRGADQDSSDAESVDSQMEDPLKHAGIYTAEEVTVIARDKLVRLQSLYIDQYRRLQHVLKEKRRKYLHMLKKEKETLSSIHNQARTSPKEQKLYLKLKALNRFHKRNGIEAVLHKKEHERRTQASEGQIIRTRPFGKCVYTEGGVRCGTKTVPVSKYCRKHILQDTCQVLFRACGKVEADHVCQEPVLTLYQDATCCLHVHLPPLPHITTIAQSGCGDAGENVTVKTQLQRALEGERMLPPRAVDAPMKRSRVDDRKSNEQKDTPVDPEEDVNVVDDDSEAVVLGACQDTIKHDDQMNQKQTSSGVAVMEGTLTDREEMKCETATMDDLLTDIELNMEEADTEHVKSELPIIEDPISDDLMEVAEQVEFQETVRDEIVDMDVGSEVDIGTS